MYLSELPEAKRYSLGWNSTTFTGPVCPVNSNIIFPAARSHSWKKDRTETLLKTFNVRKFKYKRISSYWQPSKASLPPRTDSSLSEKAMITKGVPSQSLRLYIFLLIFFWHSFLNFPCILYPRSFWFIFRDTDKIQQFHLIPHILPQKHTHKNPKALKPLAINSSCALVSTEKILSEISVYFMWRWTQKPVLHPTFLHTSSETTEVITSVNTFLNSFSCST